MLMLCLKSLIHLFFILGAQIMSDVRFWGGFGMLFPSAFVFITFLGVAFTQ